MVIESRLEAALNVAVNGQNRTDAKYQAALAALREIAMDLSQQGYGRQAIYDRVLAFDFQLQEQGRRVEQDLLEDAMDRLTGWYVGRNWPIPK